MYGGIDLHFNNSVVAVILKRSSAPMIWPPQMTTRDLVLMAGQSQSTTDRGRCCPTRIRSSADRRAGSWASWRLTRPSERSSRDWPASLGAPMLNASLRKRQQLAKRNFHGGPRSRGAEEPTLFSPALFHKGTRSTGYRFWLSVRSAAILPQHVLCKIAQARNFGLPLRWYTCLERFLPGSFFLVSFSDIFVSADWISP
jgi:hypothetical protein